MVGTGTTRLRSPRRTPSAPASPGPSAFTAEGRIERDDALLRGARRVGGWRAWVVYFFYGLLAIAVLWTVIGGALLVL
jgi:hypothetical protein